jgi:hypothetical protein
VTGFLLEARGGPRVYVSGDNASHAAKVLAAAHVVVAHQTGWAHFHEGPQDTLRAFTQVGITTALCRAPLGRWCGR